MTNRTPRFSLKLTAGILALSLITACATPVPLAPDAKTLVVVPHAIPLPSSPEELDNPALRFKYRMDPLFAGAALVLLSPLFLIIILAIKFEGIFDPDARGPIFYREARISRGKPFLIYKFRTIKVSALKRKSANVSVWFSQLDRERNVTQVGRLLLQTYLDELPQFINILRGEMAVVGPRPLFIDDYERSLREGGVALTYLKGGMTGVNQLFKGSVFRRYIRDKDYYEKCRTYGVRELFLYDLGIMRQTVFKLIKAEGL